MKKIAIVKVMGGLGNQMFQYAFAKQLEFDGYLVKVDTEYYRDIPQGDTPRDDMYSILAGGIKRISKLERIILVFVSKVIRKITNKKEDNHISEDNYKALSGKNWIEFYEGYWQDTVYFTGIENEIKAYYTNIIQNYYMTYEECNDDERNRNGSVSIHIRGGDYLNTQNINLFGKICDKEYYDKAIALINKRSGNVKYKIFTNDIDYAQSMLDSICAELAVEYVESKTALGDMYLMSRQEHHIIANSSFSWWAAWLANENGIIIAPKIWDAYGRKTVGKNDWILID